MQKEPLVTCAFSTYNASKTIEFAIESAFNQTYKNKEYLIIDDCSNDNTLQIISEINKKKNNVIHIVKDHKNRGIGEVRNQLIKISNGVFIAFFDHDDYSHPNRIKEHIVEKNTIKELIIGVAGNTSSLSQYAPKNAITLNIPSMLQIKNNLIIGCIIILSYYFLVF